jgi:OOP family OmpA-OmpF porin
MGRQSTHFRGASLAVFALAIGLSVGVAKADQTTGWYVGVLGGVNLMDETDASFNDNVGGGELSDILEHKTGFGGGALVGYDFGSFRLQGDLIYRRNKVESEIYDGADEQFDSAATATVAPMVSVLYDIDTGTAFTPYIGAGVGGASVKVDYDGTSDSEWSFAYQGVAGVNYDITSNLLVGAEYRYFATPDVDGLSIDDGTQNSYETSNHSFFLGLTYKFGEAAPAPVPVVAAPPPPPAPPAPELARSYLVFFDWNSSSVTTEAATIIGEAAKAAKQLAVTRVELTGHADRSGTPAYNQKLSEKRGAAVKNALVQLGIPADEITVVGKGEASPLVPTADGVREPQNRRVEIVLP